jgi:hypothetical protein
MWRGLVLAAAAALAATAALAAPAAGAAEKSDFVRLGYAGFLGPVQVVEASVGLELPRGPGVSGAGTPGTYRMGLHVVMSGPMAKLVPFNMTAESLGTSGAGGVRPASYESMTRIYDDGQAMRLTYGAGGAVDISAEPPTVEARVARERGLATGTLDPLSAIVALVDEVIRTGQCGGRVAVFDGTRRFDLEASPAGTAQVTKIGMSLYEGPATECAVKPVFLDGFRQADIEAGLYPDSATIWIAPVVADAPPVPVRVIGQSALGTLRLDLVEAWAMEGGCPSGQTASC